MSQHSEFVDALIRGDARDLVERWRVIAPHLPVPGTTEQAEIIMHRARTEVGTIDLKYRAYSHRWLTERNIPSGLPDILRPKAERMYPICVQGVGISVNMSNPALKPAAVIIRGAMEDAVNDAFAEGRKEPAFVSAQMKNARELATKKLFGQIRIPTHADV